MTEYRDKAGNVLKLHCHNGFLEATYYPKIEYDDKTGLLKKDQKNIRESTFGKCRFTNAANAVVFETNAKGEITKITWVNIATNAAGRKKEEMAKATEKLQGEINKIVDKYRNDPAKALEAIREYLERSGMVNVDMGKKQIEEFTHADANKK